ncbi:hypothetical protein bcere0022_17450 [Bacillus cereus Rock3-44]|nr:hypothetical protein bcere0022_17450 [Bacillus cereus Rock3-44]
MFETCRISFFILLDSKCLFLFRNAAFYIFYLSSIFFYNKEKM